GAAATESADEFVARVNRELNALAQEAQAAGYTLDTYITTDTQLLNARANDRYLAYLSKAVAEAKRYDGQELSPATRRALMKLRLNVAAPAPDDAAKRARLTQLEAQLEAKYGEGKYCPKGPGSCMHLDQLAEILARSRNYPSSPTPGRAGTPSAPACARLARRYGEDQVPAGKPIPAQLLGNMWAQQWNKIYPDILRPYPSASLETADALLKAQKWDAARMTHSAESFYTSLGFPQLPKTFWERSMLSRPRDREVVCHASAWDMASGGDVRIKACLAPTEEDLYTVYHELGHVYYFISYSSQPFLFRD